MRPAAARRRWQNTALALLALAAAWALVELALFPPLVRHLPLRVHEHLDEPLRLLAQSSKARTIPRDYVAVLGDSYAQGRGDWLLDVDAAGNPPFAAFHLLHRQLGRDVVSFGLGGAGSAGALLRWPVGALAYLRSTLRYPAPPPNAVVVLFYEGNDVHDNLRDLAIGLLGRPASTSAYGDGDFERLLAAGARSPAVVERLLREVAVGGSPWYRRARADSWTNDLVFGRFALRAVARTVAGADTSAEQLQRRYAQPAAPGANAARVGGRRVRLPDALQGPPLDLGADEVALGVELLDHAVRQLRAALPGIGLHMVYLPSPLASYDLEGARAIQARYGKGAFAVDTARIPPASDALAALVAQVAARHGAVFVDARPAIRARARVEPVHGPRDWEHFNRAGQEALAAAVAAHLRGGAPAAAGTDVPGTSQPRSSP